MWLIGQISKHTATICALRHVISKHDNTTRRGDKRQKSCIWCCTGMAHHSKHMQDIECDRAARLLFNSIMLASFGNKHFLVGAPTTKRCLPYHFVPEYGSDVIKHLALDGRFPLGIVVQWFHFKHRRGFDLVARSAKNILIQFSNAAFAHKLLLLSMLVVVQLFFIELASAPLFRTPAARVQCYISRNAPKLHAIIANQSLPAEHSTKEGRWYNVIPHAWSESTCLREFIQGLWTWTVVLEASTSMVQCSTWHT